MVDPRMHSRSRDIRIFAAGAGCGVLGGALAVFTVAWQAGALGWRTSARDTGQKPPALDQPIGRTDPAITLPVPPPANPAPPPIERDKPELLEPNTPAPTLPPPDGTVTGGVTELAARDLQIPVEGITSEMLTRQFADARGDFRVHEALDIVAPRNTPVHAVEDGAIARLFLSKAGGITVYQFDPSQRYCYYYAHLERYADDLREGDAVRKGQLLGYVGTSGNAPPNTPHLHFAVFRLGPDKRWWEGTPLDPYDILR